APSPAAPIDSEIPEPEQIATREDSIPATDVSLEPPSTGQRARRRRRRRGRGGRSRGNSQGSTSRQAVPSVAAKTSVPGTAELPEPAPTDVIAAPPPVSRPPRGVVVLAIGLPGSGKSSWFKRHNIAPLSSDLLRALLFDDPTEQRFQDLIFSNL